MCKRGRNLSKLSKYVKEGRKLSKQVKEEGS